MAKTLYEVIEEIKDNRDGNCDYFTSQASQASQDALSLCNDVDNFVTHSVTSTSQGRHNDQEPTPRENLLPAVSDPVDTSTLEYQLMELYTVKLEAIAGQYQGGCQEWLIQNRPELYQSLCADDSKIDDIWKATLAGGATAADFEAAVNAWYELQLEGIRLYRESLPKQKIKPIISIPKQDPSGTVATPEPGPEGAELISRNLQYLAGIGEDLTGWTLWRRIEQGKEHRFATDPAGRVRWERWYLIEPRLTLAAGTDQGHKPEYNS
jgi:hypothetical protein